MIQDWLATYNIKNSDDATNALREVMQEIALAGLERSGFFEEAAFYGGTALRIFYGLNRFSEDLDFSLLKPNEAFSFDKHLQSIQKEFEALGMNVSIQEKQKIFVSSIESAFLKTDTTWREIILENAIPQIGLKQRATLKIKLEVDINPPLNFETEEKLLLKPFSFYVKCFTASNLFAGKMHALLFRKWKNNVKGRDWFDMEWYIKKGIPVQISHFLERAIESGDWKQDIITEIEFKEVLLNKIENMDLNKIKADIIRFIPDPKALDIWSIQYFKDLVPFMKIV
jgi:Nucleotidyl transferase AbiEii toxin, Type IV TA system